MDDRGPESQRLAMTFTDGRPSVPAIGCDRASSALPWCCSSVLCALVTRRDDTQHSRPELGLCHRFWWSRPTSAGAGSEHRSLAGQTSQSALCTPTRGVALWPANSGTGVHKHRSHTYMEGPTSFCVTVGCCRLGAGGCCLVCHGLAGFSAGMSNCCVLPCYDDVRLPSGGVYESSWRLESADRVRQAITGSP